MVSAALATITGAYFSLGNVQQKYIHARMDALQSYYNAVAGIHSEIRAFALYGPPTPGMTYQPTLYPPGSANSTYNLTVTANADGSYTLASAGSFQGSLRNIEAVINRSSSPFNVFNFAMFSDEPPTFSGNAVTNSYDSALGSYVSQPPGSNGDVGSNGGISLSGNSVINGDATPGPGLSVTLSGNAAVTGSVAPDASLVTLPPVAVNYPASNDNWAVGLAGVGEYRLSGNQTATLSSGTYDFTRMQMSGNAVLNVSGATTIYLHESFSQSGNAQVILQPGASIKIYTEGPVSFTGNAFVNNNAPQNLQIWSNQTTSSGTGSAIQVSGNGTFTGLIYASGTIGGGVQFSGNAEVYGAVAAKRIQMSGNGNFHYDEQLGRLNLSPATTTGNWQQVSWREM
jgi:hypothetical protein